MLIKINGSILSPVSDQATHGIDIKYDIADTLLDAYHVVHTPINMDISFAGHNLIKGDVNTFNWASDALTSAAHGVGFVLKSLF
jgi:hypothetical protein